MARFKPYSYDQLQLIPVSFNRQILPGTFEHSLVYLIDHELDTTIFHSRFKNDDNGRPAYDPAILLKIVLLAYSRGITSSRKIEQLCQENVLFMAISANTQPHFTTLGDFISSSHDEIAKLFLQVLMVCDSQGLIGKEMFAIDGCKLPSNASKEWSGTLEDLLHKQKKLEATIELILAKHRETDARPEEMVERELKQIETLKHAAAKIKRFLEQSEERESKPGHVVQSNITDNESAKMKTSHGVIQGYTAVAAVDAKHQVIVEAKAYGQGQEHGLLKPTLEQAFENLQVDEEKQKEVKVLADCGYYEAETLCYLDEQQLDAYLPDPHFRSRDPRFADAKRHKPPKPNKKFTHEDFEIDVAGKRCVCPAGTEMNLILDNKVIRGQLNLRFQGVGCDSCPLREQCVKFAQQKGPRHVNVIVRTAKEEGPSLIQQMKDKIDSEWGRFIYGRRLAIVEPVFGNLTAALGLKRFSLRGKRKVNAQWQLMALLHNLFKVHRYGFQG